MDEMDPQMFSVLAARVALERLDTANHDQHTGARRRAASLARLVRLVAAPVTRRIRRAPASAVGGVRLGSGSEG
jgi:hypothetical protein